MNSPSKAMYDAICWAEGQTDKAIKKEIARIQNMWSQGPDFQFSGNADYQYVREKTLERILEERKSKP